MEMHRPEYFTDGGPWAEHDLACAACASKHAVIEVATGRFQPCWGCQDEGWLLTHRGTTSRRLRRFGTWLRWG